MLPPPVDPASVTQPTDPVARLALGSAWRLRALAHGLAHGLRRVPASHHRRVTSRVDALLAASDAFLSVPALADCGEDADRLVRARLAEEPLPYPESFAELSLADALHGGALDRAFRALRESSDSALASAARSNLGETFGSEVLSALAADAANQDCLQMLVDRWAADCCKVFGKPNSALDARLVASRIKTSAAAGALLAWLAETEAILKPWGLCMPDAQLMGIEVANEWTPARRPGRRP